MSVKIMSAVFENEALGPTERLIMLALADHADDEGRCYPSIARLCRRTGLTERAVQSNIRKLQDAGYVAVQLGAGRSGSNLYLVRATPAPDAPKPSGTIIEPSSKDHLTDDPVRGRFEDFWNEWPLSKIGKQKAASSFKRLSQQDRMAAVSNARRWAQAWRRSNPTANDIHPTTYLNGKRWEDEISPSQPQLRAVGGTTSKWGKL